MDKIVLFSYQNCSFEGKTVYGLVFECHTKLFAQPLNFKKLLLCAECFIS